MAEISDWSSTSAGNNAAPPDGFPENMLRASVNDSARELMAALRRYYDAPEFLDLVKAFTTSKDSATVVRIAGTDATAIFTTDRRIRLQGGATSPFGFVSSSAFSSPDTLVTVTLDGGVSVPDNTNKILAHCCPTLARSAFSGANVGGSLNIFTVRLLL